MDRNDSLSQYSNACQIVADEYIERSTRFGATDLKVLEALPTVRRFKVKVLHSLEVISEAKDYQGVIEAEDGDFSTADWSWYQQEVQKQAKAELARVKTLEDLVIAVKTQPYAAISDKSRIRSHPRRLFHTYKCGECHGYGQVTCHGCNGSGTVGCSGCGGDGRVSCSWCYGSGSVSEQHQVRDYTGHYRTETRYRSCYHCSGGRVTCSGCGGSGRNTCRACSGSGHVTCRTCAGHGYLTRITSTSTYTALEFSGLYSQGTPDYVHEALCRAGFPNLEQYGVIEFDGVDMIHEHARADFTYVSIMYFCELSLEITGHQSTWVMYGSPPRIHDVGGILEALLKDDFARLEALGTGWSRMFPWFHHRARRAVVPFMKSEIHQEMVNADYQGFSPSVIAEKVNRSLSEEYINRSLTRLRQTVQTAARWSSLKWTIGIALSSIPLIVSAVTFMERLKLHTMLITQDHLVIFPWISDPQPIWTIGGITIPLSFSGWLFAKWASKRWIRYSGGKQLVDWASRKGVLVGKRTAAAAIVLSALVAIGFFSMWPMWIDREGKLYGTLAVFQAPQIMEPTIWQQRKSTNRHSSRNTK